MSSENKKEYRDITNLADLPELSSEELAAMNSIPSDLVETLWAEECSGSDPLADPLTPAWRDRPTAPGWYAFPASEKYHEYTREMTDETIRLGWWDRQCYGPIPSPPPTETGAST